MRFISSDGMQCKGFGIARQKLSVKLLKYERRAPRRKTNYDQIGFSARTRRFRQSVQNCKRSTTDSSNSYKIMDPDFLETEAPDSSRDGLNTQVCYWYETHGKTRLITVQRVCTSTDLRNRTNPRTNGLQKDERSNRMVRRGRIRNPKGPRRALSCRF